MKKFLASAATLALLAPAFVSAAFNDVSLTTDAQFALTVSGQSVTLTVSGSTANVESVTAGTDTLTVVLADTSSITIASADRYDLTVDTPTLVSSETCSSTESKITLTSTHAGASQTVIVTPTLDVCSGSSSTGGSSGGGGGGGGGSAKKTTTATTTASAPTLASAPAATPTPAPTPGQSGALVSLIAQLRSLVKLYVSLGGAVSAETQAMLDAFPASPSASFNRDLSMGMTGDDVKALQVWLNANGYQVAASGPGSPGNETTMFGGATKAALAKFQAAKGISPAAGYFGPKTRAALGL